MLLINQICLILFSPELLEFSFYAAESPKNCQTTYMSSVCSAWRRRPRKLLEASYRSPLNAFNPSDHSSVLRTLCSPAPRSSSRSCPNVTTRFWAQCRQGRPDPPGGQLWVKLGTVGRPLALHHPLPALPFHSAQLLFIPQHPARASPQRPLSRTPGGNRGAVCLV